MPSLKQIKNKISSVKGTRRIMSAMKLIATVKLQRSQSLLNSYRPYSDAYKEVVTGIAKKSDHKPHPFLRNPENKKSAHLVFLTSDRGLCGSFNSNLIRRLAEFIKTEKNDCERISMSFIGRRGKDHFDESGYEIANYYRGVSENNMSEVSGELSGFLIDKFESEEVDEIFLVYSYFESALSQEIVFEQILPIDTKGIDENNSAEYIYEPTREKILDQIIPKYVRVRVERAIMESLTSEHASRMTAMDNATSNADDVIKKLTLLFNKTRQAIITTELMDIVNGTEALRKGGNN